MSAKNTLMFIFNAHLPFVKRKREELGRLEERWLFDALVWSYIPFIDTMNNLSSTYKNFSIGVSLSPTLLSMLRDNFLIEDFEQYLDDSIILGEKEHKRLKSINTEESIKCMAIAANYRDHFLEIKHRFINAYNKDIISQLKLLSLSSSIEFLTTSATHAFLPNYRNNKSVVRAQIKNGINQFQDIMGYIPKGFFLPECGYYEGIEKILEENEVQYSFCDIRAIVYSHLPVATGEFYPVRSSGPVIFFPRDNVISDLVWSSYYGYMNNQVYRAFEQDIGTDDVSLDYLTTSTQIPNVRMMTGYKYYSINGEVYNFNNSTKQIDKDISNYINSIETQFSLANQLIDYEKELVLTQIFDLTLLGHRWYEGLKWFENIIAKLSNHNAIMIKSPSLYLKNKQPQDYQEVSLSFSSWAKSGYAQIWVDESNKMINRDLQRCIEQYTQLIQLPYSQSEVFHRILCQAGRELLLAQSSDWLFMLHANKLTNFAYSEVQVHLYNFNRLYHMLFSKKIDFTFVHQLEKQSNIFPKFDYSMFKAENLRN